MRTFLGGLLLAGLCSAAAQAATFTVTNTGDAGAGSLRQAITDANAASGEDTIVFAGGVTGTITLASPLPVVNSAGGVLTITGPGRTMLTISGANTYRVFETGLASWLNISALTIANGRAPLSGSDAYGGGIYSAGTLVLYNVAINNCSAVGADSASGNGGNARGGGIYHTHAAANLNITNSQLSGCTAVGGNSTAMMGGGGAEGGGIYLNSGSGTFLQLTISNCDATGGNGDSGGSALGGGLHLRYGVTLTDGVITGCDTTGGSGGTLTSGTAQGGGLYASTPGTFGNVTLTNVTVSSCNATVSAGGTIPVSAQGAAVWAGASSGAPTLELTRCLIENCDSTGQASSLANAGGVYLGTTANLLDSRITGCASLAGTTPANGGGFLFSAAQALSVQRCTVDGNSGGGAHVQNATTATLTNCTLSGNSGGLGAGLLCESSVVSVTFSTVTANTATGTNTGGVHRASGSVTLQGCIVAANTTATGAPDIGGTVSNGGNNLVGVQDGAAAFVNGVNGCKVGSAATPLNPQLAALANNGGRTPTHALQPASPAVDAGGSTGVPATDQREAPRPFGSQADMGSYEYGATPPNTGGTAGGEGDDRCTATGSAALGWLVLALLAAATLLRRRRVRAG
ncbi:MAG: right-handed parallel beta-helix repeat-containing protein [Planctomycetes bacterium]|nr:right-handed parallel beta-helix repeat-containing protein [Planctomycetota bacterium]